MRRVGRRITEGVSVRRLGGGAESFLRGDLSSNLNFFLFYANH